MSTLTALMIVLAFLVIVVAVGLVLSYINNRYFKKEDDDNDWSIGL